MHAHPLSLTFLAPRVVHLQLPPLHRQGPGTLAQPADRAAPHQQHLCPVWFGSCFGGGGGGGRGSSTVLVALVVVVSVVQAMCGVNKTNAHVTRSRLTTILLVTPQRGVSQLCSTE